MFLYCLKNDSREEITQLQQTTLKSTSGARSTFYDCPLYGTKDRHYPDNASSLVTHVLLETEVPTDLLLKRGAMLAIK